MVATNKSPVWKLAKETGVVLWTFEGIRRPNVFGSSNLYSVVVDDKYVYVAGMRTEYAPIANVWKLDKETGELQWTYDTGGYAAYGIAVNNDGNVYIAGSTASASTPSECAVVWKLSSSGQLIWARNLPAETKCEPVPGKQQGIAAALGITLDAHGNIYVVGETWHTEYKTVWKLNSDGELLWSYNTGPYAGPPAQTTAIALDEDGYIYIVGTNDYYGKNVRKLRERNNQTRLKFVGKLLNPDGSGEYVEVGIYNEEPYYFNSIKQGYLWWDGTSWIVSGAKGEHGTVGWSSSIKFSNNYQPYGTAYGIGNMFIENPEPYLVWEIDTIGDLISTVAIGKMGAQFEENSKKVFFLETEKKVQVAQELYIGKMTDFTDYACKIEANSGGIIKWYSFNNNAIKNINAIAVDKNDNVYAGGHHNCNGISVWKISPNETVLWTFAPGLGSDNNDIKGIAIDQDENVYVVGPTIFDNWKSDFNYEIGNIVPIVSETGPPCIYYICYTAHISTSDNCPITGPNWSTYWY